MISEPAGWVLHDGKAGMACLAVAAGFRGRIESWSYPVPDDTQRAGAALRALVLQRLEQRPPG
jgi:hypothetical protein